MRAAAMLALIALAACESATAADGPAALRKHGEALLTKACAHCHAVGRRGASPYPQAVAFRTLGRRYPIESLEEALGEGIISGHPDMPEFKFSARDVGAVILYLNSIQEH